MTDTAELLRWALGSGERDLAELARLMTQACAAQGALVMLVERPEGVLELAAGYPAPFDPASALRLPLGYGVLGMVAQQNKPVLLDNDSPRDPAHRRALGLADEESVARMCIPLPGLDGTACGVLAAHRDPAQPFAAADLGAMREAVMVIGLRLDGQAFRERAIASSTEHNKLIAQAVSAQEAERRRIAGDLHDGVTQALVSLDYHLSAASASLDRTDASVVEAAEQIEAARRLSALAYDETRAAISGLHSLILDDLGLVAALESLAQTVSAAAPLEVEFVADGVGAFEDLPDHAAATLYRIAQEALNNAVKHAAASRAIVSLRRVQQGVVLAVTDDGVGFDAQAVRSQSLASGDAEHYGLSSIAERCALIGASLRIDSIQGRGTAVIVEHPLGG